jgi:hypothetical protein
MPEYPRWDDTRYKLRYGMPGLRFGRPIPSWITDPPNLNIKPRGKHTMQLPDDADIKETLGFNAADGTQQYQDTLPLKANRYDDVEPDAAAFASGRVKYDKADKKLRAAYRNLRIQRDNAKAWLGIARDLLTPTLGKKPSSAWKEAGWSDESLAIPNGEDKLMPMLRKQQQYLTDNPTLAVTDPRYNYTAARAGELLAALDAAVNNPDETGGKILGIEPATVALTTAKNERDLCEAALDRRLHGLYAELEQKLGPLDPRWTAFGFDAPGAIKRPDAVAAATFESLGAGKGKLSWTGAARAIRYQVHRKGATEAVFRLFARTDGATEILLEELTVGDKLKVRGVNDTNEGPFSPEVTVA